MIANLIGGFVTILIGTSLIGPISTQVNSTASGCPSTWTYNVTAASGVCYNSTGANNGGANASALYVSSTWGASVLQLVPGFFALGLFGVGIAVTFSSLRQAGVV
jgi:hypothetical protein